MTLQEVFDTALTHAATNAQENCAFDLSCLFEAVFGLQRYALPLHGQRPAGEEEVLRFRALLTRYLAGEPLQYLLGEWAFYGLPFRVGPGVLIPRQDTETLVDVCLALLEKTSAPVIADLCAGSGCIAVALARTRPDATVHAFELSDAAFPYLLENIARNGAGVRPVCRDVLSPPAGLPPLELVVSNPPYLSAREMRSLQLQVTHEPPIALFGGEDGLAFYRALPALWRPKLKDGGWLALEVGYTQARQTAELLWENGYSQVAIKKDLCGVERVVIGQKR